MSTASWVLGLDACLGGWAGIEAASIAIQNAPIAVIGVDMFIGLPDQSVREADTLARLAIGPRRSSVFTAPIRMALEAATYAEALEIDRFGRDFKIPLIEVHPEVTFAEMNGAPLLFSKKTLSGLDLRGQLLASNNLQIPDSLGELGERQSRSHHHPRFSLTDYRRPSGSEKSPRVNGR